MTKRAVPPADGTYPAMIHSGILMPSTDGEPRTSLTLTLTVSPAAQQAGQAVVEMVAKACDECEGDDVEDVAVLRFFFLEITLRVPEFHALMNELVANGDLKSVERVMRDPGSPGRPRGDLFVVALLEQVMAERELTATAAARWLATPGNLEQRPRYLPAEKRMRNVHSELGKIFALWRQPLYADARLLTMWCWRPPGYVSPIENFVATQLSQSVVLHSPQDSVREIHNGERHVKAAASLEQQPVESDEPEQPGVSKQSAGKR